MSKISDEVEEEMEQREEAARTEILTEKVDTLVNIIIGGGLATQDNREHVEIEQEMEQGVRRNKLQDSFRVRVCLSNSEVC